MRQSVIKLIGRLDEMKNDKGALSRLLVSKGIIVPAIGTQEFNNLIDLILPIAVKIGYNKAQLKRCLVGASSQQAEILARPLARWTSQSESKRATNKSAIAQPSQKIRRKLGLFKQ